jgi:pimeloyl-ACP methyl ester carboxylesterase
MPSDGPKDAVPELLARISTPMLVLHGPDTKPFFTAAVRYVADHVPNATLHEIPGAGHAAPLTQPEALAEALVGFFSPRQQPS